MPRPPRACAGLATCPLQMQVGTGVTVGRLSYLRSPGKGWALNNPGAPIQCQGRHGLARVSRHGECSCRWARESRWEVHFFSAVRGRAGL